jgi:hypothetical protein
MMSVPPRPEETALQGLSRAAFTVPAESVELFRAAFQLLRDTELLINTTAPDRVWEGQWALLGVLKRGYELSLSCLAMIETRNINGFYAALRGLIEALCAICWCQESLRRLPRLVSLEPVSVGKMLNAGYKRFPTMKAWYASVSQTVHPARGGHLLMWRTEDSWGTGLMTAFDSTYSI